MSIRQKFSYLMFHFSWVLLLGQRVMVLSQLDFMCHFISILLPLISVHHESRSHQRNHKHIHNNNNYAASAEILIGFVDVYFLFTWRRHPFLIARIGYTFFLWNYRLCLNNRCHLSFLWHSLLSISNFFFLHDLLSCRPFQKCECGQMRGAAYNVSWVCTAIIAFLNRLP